MQQTETYKLNLIETGDAFSPQPMNENMEKVEAVLAGFARMATGSYVGTGSYGYNDGDSSGWNTLTFDFEPKFVFIKYSSYNMIAMQGCSEATGFCSNTYMINGTGYAWSIQTRWSGNTLTWWGSDSAISQMNINNTTYYYIAIG